MFTVGFTPEKRDQLRVAYNKAVADDKETFWFECNEYVTEYTKYVLEGLDTRFERMK